MLCMKKHDERTHKQPRSNMPLQLLWSWGHKKRLWHFMQIISWGDFFMKCQSLFLGKKKKNSKLLSAIFWLLFFFFTPHASCYGNWNDSKYGQVPIYRANSVIAVAGSRNYSSRLQRLFIDCYHELQLTPFRNKIFLAIKCIQMSLSLSIYCHQFSI